MLSYEVYKNVHLLGVFMLLAGLAGLIVQSAQSAPASPVWRRRLAVTHGLGLLAALVAGFGMLAKLHIMAALPGWVIAKLVIWLILGAMIAVVKRRMASAAMLWWLVILLGTAGGYFALFKPF